MIKKHSIFKAYTLAEIVIVMLIISVVVAVTIGVTKKKLESTVSYSYYSAYESLRNVSRALLTDFRADNEDYQATANPMERLAKASGHNSYFALLDSLWKEPSYALPIECPPGWRVIAGKCVEPTTPVDGPADTYQPYEPPSVTPGLEGSQIDVSPAYCYNESALRSKCEGSGGTWSSTACECEMPSHPEGGVSCTLESYSSCSNKGWDFNWHTCECTKPNNYDEPLICPANKVYDEKTKSCICNGDLRTTCLAQGKVLDLFTCECKATANACPISSCPAGQHLVDGDKSTCKCVEDLTPDDKPDDPVVSCLPTDTPPACGQQCVDGQWQAIAGFSKTCNDTQEWRDLPDCKCVPIARSLPRNGQKFCEMFEGRVNTNSGDCSGSAISTTTTDFSDKTPDLVLRNGIRIYNLHSNPRKINDLQGNKSGFTISVDPKDLLLQHAVVNGGSLQLDKVQINQQLNQSGASVNVNNKYEVKNNLSFLPAEILMRKPLSLFPILSGLFEQKAYARCWTDVTGKTVCDGPFEGDLWNGAAQVTPGGNNAGNLNPVNPGLCATNSAMLSECTNKGGTWNSSTCKCDIPEDPEPDEPDEPNPPTPPNPNTPQVNKVQIDTGEYGYTVYVDIDGEKGSSTLWEDVFPFYITLSGQVVPAYNTVDGTELGGSSNEYLQTSVQYEKINNHGRRTVDWLSKSVSYKEGACGSGFIDSSTPYCSGVSELPECSSGTTGSKCTLKTVRPIKFF